MRLRGWMALFLLGCGHSEPFVTSGLQELGPLVPGPEARIAGGGGMTWTEDGAGLTYFYSSGCYSYAPFVNRMRYPPESVFIAGIALLPSTGGSVKWERCELGAPFITGSDSSVSIPSAAMGSGGRLLYVERISARLHGDGHDHFPAYYHVDLFLGDSSRPLNTSSKLLTLFRERTGVATVPPAGINLLTRLAWAGRDGFIGEGYQFQPDGSQVYLGLIRGTIASNSAALAAIPGTADTHRWTLAESGTSVVFADDSLILRREAFTGGAVTVVGTIPPGARRNIIDVSCREALCLVLTNEDAIFPPRISTFWTVSLSTGAVTLLRTDQKTYSSAKLSPGSNVVLVGESDGMHLFSELLH